MRNKTPYRENDNKLTAQYLIFASAWIVALLFILYYNIREAIGHARLVFKAANRFANPLVVWVGVF